MRHLIILSIMLLLVSCKKNRDNTYYVNGIKIIEKNYNNKEYQKRTFYDSVTNVYMGYDSSHLDTNIRELILFTNGDTNLFCTTEVLKKYNSKGLIRTWYKVMPYSPTLVGINFDTNGVLVYKFGSINYLTKSDSVYLSKYYPKWKEQIRVWDSSH